MISIVFIITIFILISKFGETKERSSNLAQNDTPLLHLDMDFSKFEIVQTVERQSL